jgi:hypothetical protein
MFPWRSLFRPLHPILNFLPVNHDCTQRDFDRGSVRLTTVGRGLNIIDELDSNFSHADLKQIQKKKFTDAALVMAQ